ncbi:MAG: MBL fold metallo-hydrolase [Phaeodactylibacter sp.]|uniref:MBL fold metallo-hydrolase n=1 Tax=Phaeodactylibacter sp. TaxID=1940289 RepID=UPI0032EB6713
MILISILLLFASCAVALWAYLNYNPQFGGPVTAKHQQKYTQSPQWNGQIFVNQSPTSDDVNLSNLPELIRANLKDAKRKIPQRPIPVEPFDQKAWSGSTAPFQFIWYGHSVCLMRLGGQNLLIDPMFGPDASPVGPIRTNRFSENTLGLIQQLPELDAVFLTHDHYDHLDYQSIQRLKGKVGHYFVALGVKRHLVRWGIAPERITELDWWDQGQLGDITFTFTPSRHFSGRGLTDRTKCLWGGWVFQVPDYKVYWSGDGGYDTHFREIGERFGPFDWAFMECGQYYKLWTQIHALPEEAVQVAIEAGAKVSTPVHWGGFKLAPHDWRDPVQRFVKAAQQEQLPIAVPKIGQRLTSEAPLPTSPWWEDYN